MMQRRLLQGLTVAALVVVATGCKTTHKLPRNLIGELELAPSSWVSGEVEGISQRHLLNNKDFVYAVEVSPDAKRAAVSHLGPLNFQLALYALGEEAKLLVDPNINHLEFDVEALDFSPDGRVVAAVSRDGALRLYSADTGAPVGEYRTEEPLVSVAFHPAGAHVTLGSAKGLITVVTFPELQFAFEQRAHEGEVRALAFAPDGTLYSGGWDKSVAVFDSKEEESKTNGTRVRFERRGGFSVVRGMLNGKAPTAFAFDARMPHVVVTSAVAKAAGIDVPFLKEEVTLAMPMGQSLAKVARGQSLTFKSMKMEGVDVAICDACVPAEAQGVLGAPFAERFDVAFDQASEEAAITAKDPAAAASQKALALHPRKRHAFPWYVNDLTIDREGKRLGIAFGDVKAERNREVYEREKKGIIEPRSDGNAGALVDAVTGEVVKKWPLHEGVVATAGISPDGKTVASGGWDKRVFVLAEGSDEPVAQETFGWAVRKVRFSRDGQYLGIAAWTPQNPIGDQESDPAAVLYSVGYDKPVIHGPGRRSALAPTP